MSIKIHYGANGSYKSAGAVWDDVVPAIKEGRVVISNVRGMSEERCRKAFPDAPETFKLIHIDMDSQEGLERCRTWFRWVPKGALIIFDETQLIFLTDWRAKFLESFDYPGGPEAAKEADQPVNWLDAWTRHRHWNWDIVLTTPNIKYVRTDIRRTSEGAFRHASMQLLGKFARRLLGDYKETFHDAQLNNPPPKAITKLRRINKKVFDLYDSTATGVTQDTRAGSSIFSSIPLLVLVFVLVGCAFVALGGKGFSGWFRHTPSKAVATAATPSVAADSVNTSQNQHVSATAVNRGAITKADLIRDLFDKYSAYFVGSVGYAKDEPVFLVGFYDKEGNSVMSMESSQLAFDGFQVSRWSDCSLVLQAKDKSFTKLITCRPIEKLIPQSEKVASQTL